MGRKHLAQPANPSIDQPTAAAEAVAEAKQQFLQQSTLPTKCTASAVDDVAVNAVEPVIGVEAGCCCREC